MQVMSDTEILVWWDAPMQTGGSSITGYSVQWGTDTTFGTSSNSQFVSSGNYYSITVASGTTQYVRVASYNAQGYSPFTLAKPSVDQHEVQVIDAFATTQTFKVSFYDGYRIQETASLAQAASLEAKDLQEALALLNAVDVVLVNRDWLSSYYRYRITFVDAAFTKDLGQINVVDESTNAVAVDSKFKVYQANHGTSGSANYVITHVKSPRSRSMSL